MTPDEMRKEAQHIGDHFIVKLFPVFFIGHAIRLGIAAEICERLERIEARLEERDAAQGE